MQCLFRLVTPLGPACKFTDEGLERPVDTQTRHALKKDKLATVAASSASWVGEHRSNVVKWAITAGIVVVALVAGLIACNVLSGAADTALGAAMDVYSTPLAMPGQPAEQGVYSTAADRAKAANSQFAAVAAKYGYLKQGSVAHYFAGITDQELDRTGSAETELKKASGSWDRNLSNLAKLALAGIYHQTARDNQAVDLYNQIIAKPSTTVSAAAAQLDLADLYAAQGKQDQARALWAKIQDADKQGAAGSIAAEKLGAKQ